MAVSQSSMEQPNRKHLRYERGMVAIASINLGLVLFNLSYIPWRDVYHQTVPTVTQIYDPVKGIEPNHETERYLAAIASLKEQVNQTGVQSPQTEAKLQVLRQLSIEMIENNPFAVAQKSGNLEQIKNLMRRHMGRESARQSFNIFWSQTHLSNAGWQQELNFFTTEVQPLMAVNYFRWTGKHGHPVDYFWLIDLPFVLLFIVEFLARTWTIHRRQTGVTWWQAMSWRWYDLFLCLPFWRWLRGIPVVLRLDQARIISLSTLEEQTDQWLVVHTATPLTRVVVLQIIDQIQAVMQWGDLTRWLSQRQKGQTVPEVVDEDSAEAMVYDRPSAIATILIQLTIEEVLPKVQADIVAIVHHSVSSLVHKSPVYQTLKTLPGVETRSNQLLQQVVDQATQVVYTALGGAIDPAGIKLSGKLVQNLSRAFAEAMGKPQTLESLQNRFSELLEEVKLHYIQDSDQASVEQAIQEARQLQQKAIAVELG